MGGKSTTTTPAPKDETQKAFEAEQLKALQEQNKALTQFRAEQAARDKANAPILEQQRLDAEAARERQLARQPAEDELLQIQLDRARQGTEATPEQTEQINRIAEEGKFRLRSDLDSLRSRSLNDLREAAGSFGLRPGDSPIGDRGGVLSAELARLEQQGLSGIESSRASGLLNFPLAAQQVGTATTTAGAQLNFAARDFQRRLGDQARLNLFNNRQQSGGFQLAAAGINQGTPTFQRGSTTHQPFDPVSDLIVPLAGSAASAVSGTKLF